MKPTLLIFFSILLTSCSQYQFFTVSGVNIPKNEKQELISENDTLKVHYKFGESGNNQIAIQIYNKTDQPLEVNWAKSSFIINGRSMSYHETKVQLQGRIENEFVPGILWTDPKSINGTAIVSEPLQFIPPKSSIEKLAIKIPLGRVENLSDEGAVRSTAYLAPDVSVPYKKINFEKSKSPVTFRSYLTLRIGKGGSAIDFALDHQFFISEVWKTGSGPEYFPNEIANRTDMLYFVP